MLSHCQEKVATPRKFKFLPLHNSVKWLNGPRTRWWCAYTPGRMSALPRGSDMRDLPKINQPANARKDLVTFMVSANSDVRKSGQPNFKGCRIPVPSNFNFKYLERELVDYHDKDILLLLLRYSCPINFEGNPETLAHTCKNQKGATNFQEQVDAFLKRELATGTVMVPFTTSPFEFETTVSPLNTVPKRDSAERWVIVDLSFPKHSPDRSINGGLTKDVYLGDTIQLHYPSVDNVVNLVKEKGPGCFLFKCDLSRAYRQLPVDPGICIIWDTDGKAVCSLT